MGKRKQAEVPAGVDRLAKLREMQDVKKKVRDTLTSLRSKPEWTLANLVDALRSIGRAVGIELEGE